MRVIKFRGIDLKSCKWVYGDLYRKAYRSGSIAHIIYTPSKDVELMDRKYYVDEGTVGQYTGLTDKNGKEIYEGDILENKEYGGRFRIRWGLANESYAGWCIEFIDENKHEHLLYNKNLENCEIIGNIYNNPELINKK